VPAAARSTAVALLGKLVYIGTMDARLVALT
jgi:hypothetical protein